MSWKSARIMGLGWARADDLWGRWADRIRGCKVKELCVVIYIYGQRQREITELPTQTHTYTHIYTYTNDVSLRYCVMFRWLAISTPQLNCKWKMRQHPTLSNGWL